MARETMGVPVPHKAGPSWWDRNRDSVDGLVKLLILLLTTFSGWMAASASRQADRAREHAEAAQKQSETNASHLRYMRENARVVLYNPAAEGKGKE